MNKNQRHIVSGQVVLVRDTTIEIFFDDVQGIHTIPIILEMPEWFRRDDEMFRAEVSAIAFIKRDWSNLQWSNFESLGCKDSTDRLLDEITKDFDCIDGGWYISQRT